MPRRSATDTLYAQIRDSYGSRAKTTERGLAAYQRPGKPGQSFSDVLQAALRPQESIPYEIPTRDPANAMFVQEMYATSSVFSRGIRQLAAHAAQDAMADSQPFTILVNGESDAREQKIREVLERAFRVTGVGIDTEMRLRRAMKTGMAIGEPIYEYDGLRWHLTKVKLRPTWEMFKDPQTGIWSQQRASVMGQKTLAVWDVATDFLATTTIEEDHNVLYGTPVGLLVQVDYKLMLLSLEDAAVSGRTNAPARVAHYVGASGRIEISNEALAAYRKRVEMDPMTITSGYWLKNGYEEIKPLPGDAAGTMALVQVCLFHQTRMLQALGIPPDPEKAAGRGLEEVDAAYARNINILRMTDSKFLKNIGDKALLLENMKDVDWSASIPPIGETEAARTTRASKELELGHIGHDTYCAIVGHKNPEAIRDDVRRWADFREEVGMPPIGTNGKAAARDRQQPEAGTESQASGADPQKGRVRRGEQRRAGKTVTGA